MYHLRDGNTGDGKSWSRRIAIYNLDPYIDKKRFVESSRKNEKVKSAP